jgi:hypothetical protein
MVLSKVLGLRPALFATCCNSARMLKSRGARALQRVPIVKSVSEQLSCLLVVDESAPCPLAACQSTSLLPWLRNSITWQWHHQPDVIHSSHCPHQAPHDPCIISHVA